MSIGWRRRGAAGDSGLLGPCGSGANIGRRPAGTLRRSGIEGIWGLSTEWIGDGQGFSRGVPAGWDVAFRNADDYMSGAGCIASPLDAPPTTDCVWLDQKRILAWRSKTHGLTMPAAQILGPRWVVAGPRDIVDIVGTAELGRGFPTRELGFEDGTVPLSSTCLRRDVRRR